MLENIGMLVGIVGLLIIIGLGMYEFFKLEKSKRLNIVREWLLLAVVKAEKQLGGGVGQIKLRFVYDMFIDKFKFLSMLISFNQFSSMVDEALDQMKEMLLTNQQLKEYIEK